MKIALIFLSLSLVGTIKGEKLADSWNEGAAGVGQIQVEPDLSGVELFDSLTKAIGTYMDGLQSALYDQFSYYMNYYAGGVGMRLNELGRQLSTVTEATPPDAFDVMIANNTDFLSEFLFDIRDYASKPKVLKSLPKQNARSSVVQPRTKRHALNDFASYFDLVLTSDLAMLSSYIDEMLYLGKENILQNYQYFEGLFQKGVNSTVYGQMKLYIELIDANTEKIQQHTSNWIFQYHQKVKADLAEIVLN